MDLLLRTNFGVAGKGFVDTSRLLLVWEVGIHGRNPKQILKTTDAFQFFMEQSLKDLLPVLVMFLYSRRMKTKS